MIKIKFCINKVYMKQLYDYPKFTKMKFRIFFVQINKTFINNEIFNFREFKKFLCTKLENQYMINKKYRVQKNERVKF